jgi:hypothetical protein
MNVRDDDQVSAVALVVESEAQEAADAAPDGDPIPQYGIDGGVLDDGENGTPEASGNGATPPSDDTGD